MALLAWTLLFFVGVIEGECHARIEVEYDYALELSDSATSIKTCGSIYKSSSGEIRYKKAKLARANERCVWIIDVKDAKYYDVEISFGNKKAGSEGSLSITGIRRGSDSAMLELRNPIQGDMNYKLGYTIESRILIVAFCTGSMKQGTGFSLTYSTYKDDDILIVNEMQSTMMAKNKSFIVTPSKEATLYPGTAMDLYENNDLSVFVFTLEGCIYAPQNYISIMFRKLGTQGFDSTMNTCYDHLKMYKFDCTRWNPAMENGMEMKNCGMDMNIKHNDLMMFVFYSDSSGMGSGFSLVSEIVQFDYQTTYRTMST